MTEDLFVHDINSQYSFSFDVYFCDAALSTVRFVTFLQ